MSKYHEADGVMDAAATCRIGYRIGGGLTVLEVLTTLLIVGLATGAIALFRYNAWVASRRTNSALVAAQMIERQMEELRSSVSADRAANWPPGSGGRLDSTSGVSLEWTVTDVTDPKGAPVAAVRKVHYVARWQIPRPDSLVVATYISRDF